MNVVIVDYQAGNSRSVQYALRRIGVDSRVTKDAQHIQSASHVIFPGVGHARSAQEVLRQENLESVIKSLTQPLLGICLGMQLLGSFLEESSETGLNIIEEKVLKFSVPKVVPHIGWSNVEQVCHDPLFCNVPTQSYFYFLHSYFVQVGQSCIAKSVYGENFSAAIRKDNFVAVQFHPEKSGEQGEQILKNFLGIS